MGDDESKPFLNGDRQRHGAGKIVASCEQKYSSLVKNLGKGFCIIEILFDVTGKPIDHLILEVNEEYVAQTGIHDPVGKTANEIVPNLEDHWHQRYADVAITGKPINYIDTVPAWNRWFEIHAFKIGPANDRTVGIIITDITTAKRAEQEIQDAKGLLQAVCASAPNGIAVMQAVYDDRGDVEDFTILLFNDFTLSWIGDIEYKGERYSEVFPSVRKTGILDKFKAVAITGVTANFEQWYDGEGMNHWFRFTAVKHDKLLVVTTEDVTKEKLAEQEIKESEERFAAAVEAVEGIIWTNNPEGEMVGIQPGWAELTGQTYEQYQGYGWATAVHPDDAERSIQSWNEAVRMQKTFELEHRVKTANHQWRKFFVKAIPLRNADGSIRQWVGVHTDVTEQREAQEAIKASESRFHNLVRDATAAIVVLIGEDMKVEIANEAYGRLIDHKPSELLGKPIFSVAPETEEYYLPILKKVVQTGEPVILHESPYTHVTKGRKVDGFLHIVSQPYRDSAGEILGVMQILQDVTEYVRARKALEVSESKFRSLIEEAPIATALFTGRELRIEVANDTFIGYIGKDRSVIGNPYAEVVPELRGQGFFENLDDVFTSGQSYSQRGVRVSIIHSGVAQSRYFDFIAKPIKDSEGKVYAIIDMAADVTERVKSEQELKESEKRFRNLSETLENEVQIRTRQLMQSNEDLQQFAHVASHDLKEPVRKIKTFAGRIQDEYSEGLDSKVNLYLEKIQSATDRMVSMIDGVLAYSSINATELVNEAVDLNHIIRSIELDLEIIIQQKQAQIKYHDLPKVEGASVLLYQLFYNLINNSIKFGRPEESVVISIDSQIIINNGKDSARILVRDNCNR